VFGDGDQVVDLVYSPDLAHLTVQFLAEEYTDAVVECGRGVGLTVNQVALAVNEVTGNRGGVRHLPMRRGEDESSTLVADLEVLSKLVGDPCFTDLETSLDVTIDWYRRLPSTEIDHAVDRLCA
jgi:nucleoside-diphosphate-sugar epimerase